jgi:hypothetical protein
MVATAGEARLKESYVGLRDYLHGSRGQTRMSVYGETGAGYLTRTEGLIPRNR